MARRFEKRGWTRLQTFQADHAAQNNESKLFPSSSRCKKLVDLP